ncbi:hypothetical protein MRB53_041454 [Persea americana]|nr:hypothetical protein MRB53_041454 [Persea americana]
MASSQPSQGKPTMAPSDTSSSSISIVVHENAAPPASKAQNAATKPSKPTIATAAPAVTVVEEAPQAQRPSSIHSEIVISEPGSNPQASGLFTTTPSDPEKSPAERKRAFWRSPAILRNSIIGFSDGMTMPFALAAGLSAFGSTRLAAIGGLAEIVSGVISMAFGAYLAALTDRKRHLVAERQVREELDSREADYAAQPTHSHEKFGPDPDWLHKEQDLDIGRQGRREA